METLLRDLKAATVIILLSALLYPAIKNVADQRIKRLQHGQGDGGPLGPLTAETPTISRGDEVLTPIPRRKLSPMIRDLNPKRELLFPVEGHGREAVISYFGDARGKTRTHAGIDIKAPKGTPVIAVTDGVVESVKNSGAGGKQVWLLAEDGKRYFYGHLDDWAVEEADMVYSGDVLGYVGNTGNASGTIPHLHFEIMTNDRTSLDPLPILFPEEEAKP